MTATDQRIAEYAYRYWMREGMTAWPQVRSAARSLGIRQAEFDECSDLFHLTGYNISDELGDLWVEATIPAVDKEWCEYWKGWHSAACTCGQHADQQSGKDAKA